MSSNEKTLDWELYRLSGKFGEEDILLTYGEYWLGAAAQEREKPLSPFSKGVYENIGNTLLGLAMDYATARHEQEEESPPETVS